MKIWLFLESLQIVFLNGENMRKSTIALICFCLGVIVCGLMSGCVSIGTYRREMSQVIDTVLEQNKAILRLNQKVTDTDKLLAEEIDRTNARQKISEKVFSDSIADLDIKKADRPKKK